MVKYKEKDLDLIFASLSDLTRRKIIGRLGQRSLTVSEIAKPYAMSLPAVSKHLKILERAHLVKRTRKGREHLIELDPNSLKMVEQYISHYNKFWNKKLDNLQHYLEGGDT